MDGINFHSQRRLDWIWHEGEGVERVDFGLWAGWRDIDGLSCVGCFVMELEWKWFGQRQKFMFLVKILNKC